MPKIIKAGKVLTSNSLNAEMILSENTRKQNELDRIANDATRANVVEAIEIEYAPRLTTVESQLVDTVIAVDEIPTTPLPREADRLGGFDASYFAPKASAQMYKLTADDGKAISQYIVDFNTAINVGTFFSISTTLNKPCEWGLVKINKSVTGLDITQTVHDVSANILRIRVSNNGGTTWTAWKEMADTSQVIVESGSNANGRYIKFGDGTMICKMNYPLTTEITGSGTNQGLTIHRLVRAWIFPAGFYDVPTVVANAYQSDYGLCATSAISNTTDGATIVIQSLWAFNAYAIASINVMAIGRWKA